MSNHNGNGHVVIDEKKKYASRQHRNGKIKKKKRSGFREDLGHYCKNAWVANYARVLKHLKIDYDFKCKKFELRQNGIIKYYYTPDLYIPSLNEYVEIRRNTTKRFDKIIKMFKRIVPTEAKKLTIVDKDMYSDLLKKFKDEIDEWE